MFKNNEREFVISLPKQPKCKREQMSLSLPKKKDYHCPNIILSIFSDVCGCYLRGIKCHHFPGNYVACHFHPKKAFFTKTYNGMTVSFHCYTLLAMWPGGRCIKLQIRGSWVQVPPDPVVPSLNPHPCSGLSKVAGCR